MYASYAGRKVWQQRLAEKSCIWLIHADRFLLNVDVLNLVHMSKLNKFCMLEIGIFERSFNLPWC